MQIDLNGKEIVIADSWNELTLGQQLTCYQILMQDTTAQILPTEVVSTKRIFLMLYLLDIGDSFLLEWEKDRLDLFGEDGKTVFAEELQELATATTHFFFQEVQLQLPDEQGNEQTHYTYALTLTKIPYPFLITENSNGRKKKLYGPTDALANISLYELAATFSVFERYLKTKQESLIDSLLAILYRPRKRKSKKGEDSGYNGDIRRPYLKHESTADTRAAAIANIPTLPKALILFWFASCRQQIIQAYPLVFVQDNTEQKGNNYGWGGVLMQLSGGIVHLDQVSAQPYGNALTYLSFLEDQRRERETEALRRSAK